MARSVRSGRVIELRSSSSELDEIEQLDELGEASSPRPARAASSSRSSRGFDKIRPAPDTGSESPIIVSSRSTSTRASSTGSSSTSPPTISRKRKRPPGRPARGAVSVASSDEDVPLPSSRRSAPRAPVSVGGSESEVIDLSHDESRTRHAAWTHEPSTRATRRAKLVVELPLMPLAQLRQYGLSANASGPSRSSRRRLLDAGSDSDYYGYDDIQLDSEESDYHEEIRAKAPAMRNARLAALVGERRGARWAARSPPARHQQGGRSSAELELSSEGESELYTDTGDKDVGSSELDSSEQDEDREEDELFVRRSKRQGSRNGRKSGRSDVSFSFSRRHLAHITTPRIHLVLPLGVLAVFLGYTAGRMADLYRPTRPPLWYHSSKEGAGAGLA